MEIINIEPTPNPNSMKITLSEEKSDMRSSTYNEITNENPEFANELLKLEDVKSIFHALNFISIDKKPNADWDALIPEIEAVFNDADGVKKNN